MLLSVITVPCGDLINVKYFFHVYIYIVYIYSIYINNITAGNTTSRKYLFHFGLVLFRVLLQLSLVDMDCLILQRHLEVTVK